MKKLFKYMLVASIIISLASCKKNNLVVGKNIVPPEFAGFVIYPTSSNSYYNFNILSSPTPGTAFKLPVGLTTVANVDRKVKFTYSSNTAVAGVQYTAPSEITIPAGKAMDTLSIQGLFAGYTTGRLDTLKVKIINETGYVSKNGYSDSVMLVMKRTCPLNLDNLSGTMQVVSDEWGDYSPGDLITLTKVNSSTISFLYLADNPMPILMSINPTTYAVTVANQVYGSGYGGGSWPYGNISCKSVDGASSVVDPCENTISVKLTHTVSAGSFGSYIIVFKKP
jgi:hypothetical protein